MKWARPGIKETEARETSRYSNPSTGDEEAEAGWKPQSDFGKRESPTQLNSTQLHCLLVTA